MKEEPLSIQIERRIFLIRGHKVMLDYDLASLYRVETRALKQAVRRNSDRFPEDFMFELNREESGRLVSQNVIPSLSKFGGASPMAFSEQGVAMLSSVLRSPHAVQVNIAIMRAFVRLRECGPFAQAPRSRTEIRFAIQSHFRCHSPAYDPWSRKRTSPDRFPLRGRAEEEK
jgi:hypothetical protein